ncbi:hypothetical protein COV18_05680 [Candidatus Woesearchaeota archaeon CG10_big_fil_rev_8_21_14_0_10_37_12]|nr:MAG: hypothetical protein COV18_05680 [Candidatus Woesearchaeota archaeon CG10_big_fil_rev_8_21_14_0_10_37_12]
MPTVLVGIVTSKADEYCLDEFLACLRAQSAKGDVLFVVNHGQDVYAKLIESKTLNDETISVVVDPKPAGEKIDKILNGRNYLRNYALEKGHDYLFMVDSDVLLPQQALLWLVALKEDVVTGVYLNNFYIDGKNTIAPVLFKDLGKGECQLYTYEGAAVNQLLEIGAAGFGCTLISKRVLQEVPFRKIGHSGEDMAFYVDARAKGFKTVANTFVKCVHRPYPADDPRARLFEWRTNVENIDIDLEIKD